MAVPVKFVVWLLPWLNDAQEVPRMSKHGDIRERMSTANRSFGAALVKVAMILGICVIPQRGAALEKASDDVIRITLLMAEDGTGKVTVDRLASLPESNLAGGLIVLRTIPKTRVHKAENGTFRIVHDFAAPDDLRYLDASPVQVELAGNPSRLVFTPDSESDEDCALLKYARRIRPPLEVTCLVSQLGSGLFGIELQNLYAAVEVSIRASTVDGRYIVRIAGTKRNHQKAVTRTVSSERANVDLSAPLDREFRFPDRYTLTEPLNVRLRAWGDKTMTRFDQTHVSRLSVQGKMLPEFGMRLETRHKLGRVCMMVTRVDPDSPAAAAGIRERDEVAEIDGRQFSCINNGCNPGLSCQWFLDQFDAGTEVTAVVIREAEKQAVRLTGKLRD